MSATSPAPAGDEARRRSGPRSTWPRSTRRRRRPPSAAARSAGSTGTRRRRRPARPRRARAARARASGMARVVEVRGVEDRGRAGAEPPRSSSTHSTRAPASFAQRAYLYSCPRCISTTASVERQLLHRRAVPARDARADRQRDPRRRSRHHPRRLGAAQRGDPRAGRVQQLVHRRPRRVRLDRRLPRGAAEARAAEVRIDPARVDDAPHAERPVDRHPRHSDRRTMRGDARVASAATPIVPSP